MLDKTDGTVSKEHSRAESKCECAVLIYCV